MKAAFIRQTGSPDEISFGELPMPEPAAGEVRVRMEAVAVNPIDTYLRRGLVPMDLPFPFVIGRDLAGTVEKVGPNVTRFQTGDRVWTNSLGIHGRQGTFSEFVCAPEDRLYPLPATLDFIPMVALVHSALTACLGFERMGGLHPGQLVFINGGAGNVGRAVTQLAVHGGARVISTAGNDAGRHACRADGAEACLDYHSSHLDEKLRALAPEGIDLYWDTSGQQNFEFALRHLRHRGRIAVMSGLGVSPALPVGPLYVNDITIHGFAVTYATTEELAACAEKINALAAQGHLTARVDRVLPLAEAREAHRLLEAKDAKLNGKIVLVSTN